MSDTWTLTVLTLMNSDSAISRLVCPAIRHSRISTSRAVSPGFDGGSASTGSLATRSTRPHRASISTSATSRSAPSPVAAA